MFVIKKVFRNFVGGKIIIYTHRCTSYMLIRITGILTENNRYDSWPRQYAKVRVSFK